MEEYLYSWSERGQQGYRQTIKEGRVINIISIPIKEAKEKYYETRSQGMQDYDAQQEEAARISLEQND